MTRRYVNLARLALVAGGAVLLVQSLSAQKKSLKVVPQVDLERYAGKWFEIARLPNKFQDACASDVSALYKLRPDGRGPRGGTPRDRGR